MKEIQVFLQKNKKSLFFKLLNDNIYIGYEYGKELTILEDLISINESRLDRLVLDIGDHLEKINNILNQINDLILDSKNYFASPVNNKMISVYESMKLNINNFKFNVSTYSSDLIKVKVSFKQKASDIAQQVRDKANLIQSESK